MSVTYPRTLDDAKALNRSLDVALLPRSWDSLDTQRNAVLHVLEQMMLGLLTSTGDDEKQLDTTKFFLNYWKNEYDKIKHYGEHMYEPLFDELMEDVAPQMTAVLKSRGQNPDDFFKAHPDFQKFLLSQNVLSTSSAGALLFPGKKASAFEAARRFVGKHF